MLQNQGSLLLQSFVILQKLDAGKILIIKLKHCHEYFPEEPESYELEGRIFLKIRKWKEAIQSFLKYYDFTHSLESMANIATCYEELNRCDKAL